MIDLRDKKVAVLGRNGFLGTIISRQLEAEGAIITSTPERDSLAVVNFASPTHIPFGKNSDYHAHEFINSFLYLFPFCQQNGIHLIWPSSALVYEKDTPFAHLKKTVEEMQGVYPDCKSLGLRIFPVYGVGERDRGNSTFIFQSCQAMKKGERPIVYGDGTQHRDFVYVDDVGRMITKYIKEEQTGIKDIGTGQSTSFNEIIKMINEELKTNIEPLYRSSPVDYSAGIECKNPMEAFITVKEGIRRILNES